MQDLVKTGWHEFRGSRVEISRQSTTTGGRSQRCPNFYTSRVNLVSRHFGDSSSLPSVGCETRGKREIPSAAVYSLIKTLPKLEHRGML